jgi:hypothetical protein
MIKTFEKNNVSFYLFYVIIMIKIIYKRIKSVNWGHHILTIYMCILTSMLIIPALVWISLIFVWFISLFV